ncbi:MAG: malate synthase A [Acidobacteria bacterium]|nr:malate synthase A [Acidobacteriota bacterium]
MIPIKGSERAIDQRGKLNAAWQKERIEVLGPVPAEFAEILTPEALRFVAKLARAFEDRRQGLLEARARRQAEIDKGNMPTFLEETKQIHEGGWKVAPIPEDLLDRKVEITGPTDRKMIINALNSGANVFMADFEDSNSPTWDNMIRGQTNLRDAIRRTITYDSPEGRRYELNEKTATLLVRPRGWHLMERHVLVDGRPISGSLFDFGLYLYHNAHELMRRGTGPYYYLPKLENHQEARLWNDVFNLAQDELGIPRGTVRATVLLETILAAFEMDEILLELKDHSAGLNFGRWDYIFSFIKKFSKKSDLMLPERSQVTMDKHFLKSSVDLLVHTCHKRGIHAIGGMAAQIPRKDDLEANETALAKVRADKEREVAAGHDGTWVAHPGLVPVAKEIFDRNMPGRHQIDRLREDAKNVTAKDLLTVPEGDITEKGLRTNIDVPILYLESWLRGTGCVAIYYLMEDAATVEISRAQMWQWLQHGAKLNDGRAVTPELVKSLIDDEMEKIRKMVGAEAFESGKFQLARALYETLVFGDEFIQFMTLLAYNHID